MPNLSPRTIAITALARLLLLAVWRVASTPPAPRPPAASGSPAFDGSLIPDSPDQVPDCPPELRAAFSSASLVLEPLSPDERRALPLWPDDAADVVEARYTGPVRIWCLGRVRSFTSDIDAVTPTPVYVTTGVASPSSLVLVDASARPGAVLRGVAGSDIKAWLDRQPR